MALIPSDIKKNKRSQYQKFIDITPSSAYSWKIVGIGITEANMEFNPQVETEQWIIEDNARTDHTGNQKQIAITQKCYKNDPEFEFINQARDELNYTSHILEVDTWDGTAGSYPAKVSDCLITVTSYSGAEIEYTIYVVGDPTSGTCSITDGVPTFTPNTSL